MFFLQRKLFVKNILQLFVLVLGILCIPSAKANFEVPYLDSTNSISTAELRGVWMANRGYKSPVSLKLFNGFESYAVGYDTDPTKQGLTGGFHTNGVLYYSNGSGWSRIANPMLTAGATMPIMNAISGQMDYNEGNPGILMTVGEKGQVYSLTLQDNPGNTSYAGVNRFKKVTASPEDLTRDYYAVDGKQTFNSNFMAGGQAGLYSIVSPGSHTRLTVVVSGDGARTALNANENITGIRYADSSTVFVLTSTFSDGDRYSVAGKTCTGTQTSRLYKTKDSSNAFQYIGSISRCGYGISVGQRSLTTGTNNNIVWIATNDGVYRYDEFLGGGIVGPLSNTSGKKLYSISATAERGGDGVNLLKDGGFESWLDGSLTQWVGYSGTLGRNNGATYEAGSCASNTSNIFRDTGTGLGSTYAVRIKPGAAYNTNTCTASSFDGGKVSAVFSRVDMTATEGQILKISGDYTVSFPTPLPAVDTGRSTVKAQGGVSIGCTEAIAQDAPNYVGCSYQNRTNIRTIGNPTSGWQHFETTISRNNSQFSQIINIGGGAGKIQPRRMFLEIRCEATFGADVSCDNIQVTEVSNPPIPAQDTFVVTAVGQDRTIVSTTDALASLVSFGNEQQPEFTAAAGGAGVDYLNVFGVSTQHVAVVGESSTLLSRTPSTLKGYIWAGTVDPATVGTTTEPPGLGAISVSCINRTDIVGVQTQTLCQQEQSSYGLQLSIQPGGAGLLSGRAWFGKSIGTVSDEEQRSLGSCQRSDVLQDPTNLVGAGTYSSMYDIHGMCDTSVRRCFSSRAESRRGFGVGTVSNYSCLSDFDCYGRCQLDQGALCVVDNDCALGASSSPAYDIPIGAAFNPLTASPATKLACTSGSVLGCTAVGWLSLDAKDLPGSASTTPENGATAVLYNIYDAGHNSFATINNQGGHEFSGWGRFLTLANPLDPNYTNSGWVRFRGPDVAGQGKLFSCQDCYGDNPSNLNCAFCRDDANHSCTPSDSASEASCHYSCAISGAACVVDAQCPTSGDSCKPIGYCSGNVATSCRNDQTCSDLGQGTCLLGAQCTTTNARCSQYGVRLNTTTGQFNGYAWSEDFGWLDFRNVTLASSRFFQTKLGDIYAGTAVGNPLTTQPSGVNNCNATFLILSAGTIASNWCSAIETTVPAGVSAKQSFVTPLQLPSSANVYRNILGRFDLLGIEKIVTGGLNKYGSRVVPLTPSGQDIAATFGGAIGAGLPLGNRVFTVGDPTANPLPDYTLNSAMTFYASTDLAAANQGSGAGLLIVNGNLTIGAGLSYANIAGLDDTRKLQNLVIVVKGDLTIDNTVQKLVGSYYVMGTIHTASSSTGSNQYPLEIRGLVIAKDFDLGRTFAGTVENPAPSELIIADGRIQANPMPGMTDFVKSLPSLTAQP